MDSFAGHQRRHRGQRDRACEAAQPRRGQHPQSAGRADGGKLTTVRTLMALGAFAAKDLRDRDGVARPLLRRAAVRMIDSRRETVRRVGIAYLRGDPPVPDELPAGAPPAFGPRQLPPDSGAPV